MKILLFSILILLVACSENTEKANNVKPSNGQSKNISSGKAGTHNTKEDNKTIEWLVGKEWTAENEAAPFSTIKIYSKDSCSFSIGTYNWSFKNNRLQLPGADWPFNQLNDTTFTIYVDPTQKTFAYKFVRDL